MSEGASESESSGLTKARTPNLLRLWVVSSLLSMLWFILVFRFLQEHTNITPEGAVLLSISIAVTVFGTAAFSRRMIRSARRWENLPVALLFLGILSAGFVLVPAVINFSVRLLSGNPLQEGESLLGVFGAWSVSLVAALAFVGTQWYVAVPSLALSYGALKWAAGTD